MRTALYRHFDADGVLLYVGISLSAVQRLSQHRKAPWFHDIDKVEVEWFDMRAAAEAAEIEAIRSEKPVFNIAYAPMPLPPNSARGMRYAVVFDGVFNPDKPPKYATALSLAKTISATFFPVSGRTIRGKWAEQHNLNFYCMSGRACTDAAKVIGIARQRCEAAPWRSTSEMVPDLVPVTKAKGLKPW